MTQRVPDLERARREGRVVLVVEDNLVNRRMIGKLLTVIGIASEAVATGQEALERFDPTVHGLILTDVRMPGIDGVELARRVRSREAADRRPAVPIIAFSADVQTETQRRCQQAGMNGYIAKPVELETLRPLLDRWLKPQAAPGTAQA